MLSTLQWTKLNAYGASIISGLTVLASLYLLISLVRQGRGKLRVRLLIGMVVSDLLLGIVAIVPESRYLAGHPMVTGTGGCDAQAFLLTTIVFTQHLWTLSIAISTFLLLKYPLSPLTTLVERFSWIAAPSIWSMSLLHAVWWKYVGWSSATGNLCYYAPAKYGNVDARDLVQFIPRALVFVIICTLYSTLFNFLRRPDTIQLSSQFVSGGAGTTDLTSAPKFMRRAFKASKSQTGGVGATGSVNPDAPWEQLEFVQIGHNASWRKSTSPVQTHVSQFNPQSSNLTGILLTTPLASPTTEELGFNFSPRRPSFIRLTSTTSTDTPVGLSENETLVTPELRSSEPKIQIKHPLSPVLSDCEAEGEGKLESGLDVEDEEDMDRRPSGQTMGEFFKELQAEEGDVEKAGSGGKGVTPLSATAYFNRQASLLMLYFPLAYLIVFSVSLVRLVYDMVRPKPSFILTTLSAWMVVSVGLIDGLVYGLAEFMVRRRVRRKMPDRM